MKTSLNGARLGADKLDFFQFVDLAARHGFDGVDFGMGSARAAAQILGGPHLLRDYLKDKGIAPASFGLDVEWRKDESTFQSGMVSLEDQARFAQVIGAERCLTWLPPSVADAVAWDRDTLRRFGAIAAVLHKYGIRFGLEWVGPHHLRAGGANAMGASEWIYTLPGTLALIEKIGVPSVGLLVDSYHCYTTGIGERELAQLSDAQIVHVHINDAPRGVGPSGAKDGERLLPGEGEIDLAGFLRGLRAANYAGYVAAEVLAPLNISADPDTAAARVRESLRAVGV